jgi:CheY-like chemotaxis protein
MILLVDDSPRDTEMALDVIRKHHLASEVVALRDGVEALDYIFRRGDHQDRGPGEPAVILLDLKMPRVDGLEVLRQLKGDSRLKIIPVVVMTSSREEQDLLASYALGVNAYVVKPLDFAAYVECVKCAGEFWAVLNELPPIISLDSISTDRVS